MFRFKPILAAFFIMLVIVSCNEGKVVQNNIAFASIKDIPESALSKLSKSKIYFGHQSVGYNIVDGIMDVMKENHGINLKVVDTNDPEEFDGPIFAHSKVGRNTEPDSKVDAFSGFLESGLGNRADVAFMKMCYVDANPSTDVEAVFRYYSSAMVRLKERYPKVAIVHVTMPLVSREGGIKALAKRVLGRPLRGYADNVKRKQFNELMREQYSGKEPLFDLARIESTRSDGSRTTFRKGSEEYHALVPEYTYDGGHLNETGRKIVAEQLLVFLADLAERTR